MPDTLSKQACIRSAYMVQAIIEFHSRNVPQRQREITSWFMLLEWARLGGKPGEVIR